MEHHQKESQKTSRKKNNTILVTCNHWLICFGNLMPHVFRPGTKHWWLLDPFYGSFHGFSVVFVGVLHCYHDVVFLVHVMFVHAITLQ